MTNMLVVLTLAGLLFSVPESEPEGKSLLSSFCQFPVSEQMIQSSISFTEIYSFTLNEKGNALGIKRVSGDYLKLQEVVRCLSRWEFSGFAPRTRVTVSFTWKHGAGWTEMKVLSKDFVQTTLLNGTCSGGE